MDNMDIFNILYNRCDNIIKLYDYLFPFLISNNRNINYKNVKNILNKIKNEFNIECDFYNNLDINDIDNLMKIINDKSNERLDFVNIRINMKLSILYDKLYGNKILNLDLIDSVDEDLNFSMIDLITSKIVIDIYKLLDSKLDNIVVCDNKSICYANDIRILNMQYVIYRLCLNEVTERLGLEYGYDIKKIPSISFNEIEKNIFETYGIDINLKNNINSKIFTYLLSKINEFGNLKMNIDDYESIYDNLLYVSTIEVLISYLNSMQLEFILIYFSRINSDNKIVSDNIKKLVRSKINEL